MTPTPSSSRHVDVDLSEEEAHAFRSVLDDVFLGSGQAYGEDLRSVFEEGGLGPKGSTLRQIMGMFGLGDTLEGWGADGDGDGATGDAMGDALRRAFSRPMPPTPPAAAKVRRVPGSPRPDPAAGAAHMQNKAGAGNAPRPQPTPTGFAAVLAQMEEAARALSGGGSAAGRGDRGNTPYGTGDTVAADGPSTASAFHLAARPSLDGAAMDPHQDVDAPTVRDRYTLVMDEGQAQRARHLLFAVIGPFAGDRPTAEDPAAIGAAKRLGLSITDTFPDLPMTLPTGNIVVTYQDGRQETYGTQTHRGIGLVDIRAGVQDKPTPKTLPTHPRPGAGYPKKRRPAQDER